MPKAHLFTVLLLLFMNFINVAQSKEYSVSYENDTIYGDVKRKSNLLNPSKVDYKIKLPNGERVNINPNEIKLIHTSNGIDGDSNLEAFAESSFVKLIIDGRIKLYQLPDTAFYYISKANSNIQLTRIAQPFSNKEAHAEIASLLSDEPSILQEFEQLEGSFKNISYIINKYNSNLKLKDYH